MIGTGLGLGLSGYRLKTGPYNYALGGTVTESAGYRIHSFTSSSTLSVVGSLEVEYLVAAGGGGGGFDYGAGGGSGGFRTGSLTLSAGSYSLVIGAGGSRPRYIS